MKVLILILALSAIASATLLRQANPTKNYENPWNADPVNGKCSHDEVMDKYTDKGGLQWAICMPILFGDWSQCPKPPLFDSSRLDAFDVRLVPKFPEQNGCVVECSHSLHLACPIEARCLDAREVLRTEHIKKICYYPQHVPAPPGPTPAATEWYEDPFIASKTGSCHPNETEENYIDKDDGTIWGQCMPELYGDWSQCPKPPGFKDLWLSAYDVTIVDPNTAEVKYACQVECTYSHDSQCPKGAKCFEAPKERQNDRTKNICLYPKVAAQVLSVIDA